jgi:DtxR family Mn-dependent transcriptional regulator
MSSATVEDYLKAIYLLQEEAGGPAVGTSALAERLALTPASASSMITRLAQVDLVVHVPYQGVRLTEAGEKMALRVIRRHRLLELYLAEKLGLGWDQVHEEAERLEHHISPTLEARIAAALGDPQVDPHGHPIPTPAGEVAHPAEVALPCLAVGQPAFIGSVGDEDPELLRYLAAQGMYPGVPLVITNREPFGGSLHLWVGSPENGHVSTVSLPAAGVVRVMPTAPASVAPSLENAALSDTEHSTNG